MDEYKSAITKYDRLCEERNNNKFWAENITEATENISSLIVWQNFYAYLANSNHKFTNVWKPSLGEQVDQGLKVKYDDREYKTKTVHNGNVTYIKMTPDNLNVLNKDGEQMDSVPEGIQEEKSNSIAQASNEIRKFRV